MCEHCHNLIKISHLWTLSYFNNTTNLSLWLCIICVQNYVVLDVISNQFSIPVATVEEKMRVSTFHSPCIQYNWTPKSINVYNWFFDNIRIDGHPSSPSLTSISDTGVRTVEKWTGWLYVVVFCMLVKEKVNSYRYSISWILGLYRQHWATTIRSRCTSTPFSLYAYWTATHVVWGSLSIRTLKETVHPLRK